MEDPNSPSVKIPKAEDPISVTADYLEHIDKAPRWDSEELLGLFRSLPYLMQIHLFKAIELQNDWELAKIEESEVKSELRLKSVELKNRKELTSEGDRDAWVLAQPAMRDARRKTLAAKKAYDIQNAWCKRLDDTFISARKAAQMAQEGELAIDKSQIGPYGRLYN